MSSGTAAQSSEQNLKVCVLGMPTGQLHGIRIQISFRRMRSDIEGKDKPHFLSTACSLVRISCNVVSVRNVVSLFLCQDVSALGSL
jgi:hypothetical protein